MRNHHVETRGYSSHSSGITALLDKNLLISSNEALQEIPEEEMEGSPNENGDKQINCHKHSISDDLLTENIFKRRRV